MEIFAPRTTLQLQKICIAVLYFVVPIYLRADPLDLDKWLEIREDEISSVLYVDRTEGDTVFVSSEPPLWEVFSKGDSLGVRSNRSKEDRVIQKRQIHSLLGNRVLGRTLSIEEGVLFCADGGEHGSELWWLPTGDLDENVPAAKVSNHRVNSFSLIDGRLYAATGLSHMGDSRGSVIELHHLRNSYWAVVEIAVMARFEPLHVFSVDPDRLIVLTTGPPVLLSLDGSVITKNVAREFSELDGGLVGDRITSSARILSSGAFQNIDWKVT